MTRRSEAFLRQVVGRLFDSTFTQKLPWWPAQLHTKSCARVAFDAACKELHDKGQPAIVYEVIAKRIIDAAKNGERDPVQLRNIGLAGLGFDKGDKQAI